MNLPGYCLIDFKKKIVSAREGDEKAEEFLRDLLLSLLSSSNVPLAAILELCETLVTIREIDAREHNRKS